MDTPLARRGKPRGRGGIGTRSAYRRVLPRRSGDGRRYLSCRASDQRETVRRSRPFRLSGRGADLRQLHANRGLRGRAPAAPARRPAFMTGTRAALALSAGFLLLLIGGGARFAFGMTFKPMVDEFGWARGELGLAVGVYMLVSPAATFLTGRLADRLSPRALLIGGTIVGGVGIGLMSL